jgi:hypothetical protein
MKGVITGVKEFQKLVDAQKDRRGGSGESAFLKLDDGQAVTIRFLQELDASGSNFDDDRGLAVSVFEHVSPEDFRKRFRCTTEIDGRCVGCERQAVNPKWGRRARMYINAFVREDNSVKMLATNFSSQGYAPMMIEYFNDFKSITDRDYKLKRVGKGLGTSYVLTPREVSPFTEDVQLRDLDVLLPLRNYDECVNIADGTETRDAASGW